MRSIINKIRFFGFLLNHPLNRGRKFAALLRYLRWQIGSRIVPGAVAVPYVNDARLLVLPGMAGATGNIYVGLHEFEDMSFVLHCLRKEDVFVDIGANIGSYSVLAGVAVGARCVSIEPIPSTFTSLQDNINLNGARDRIMAHNIGVGEKTGELFFSGHRDTVNHVLADGESREGAIAVEVKTLDEVLADIEPTLIKIDVEGFETNVIGGADSVLSKESLLGVIMELNGSGSRYGFDEEALHARMLDYGFVPYCYRPFDRQIVALDGKNSGSGNTLYLRRMDEIRSRVEGSSKYRLQSVEQEI